MVGELQFPLEYLGTVFKHCWLAIRLAFFSSIESSYHKNWLVLAYCKDRFLASLSFAEFRPKVYLSRLDYSHRHHALGAACKEFGCTTRVFAIQHSVDLATFHNAHFF